MRNCTLVASAAAFDVLDLLDNNQNITIDQFVTGMADIIFMEDDIRSALEDYKVGKYDNQFAEYLHELGSVARSAMNSVISKNITANFRSIGDLMSGPATELIDTIGQEVIARIATEKELVTEKEEDVVVTEEKPQQATAIDEETAFSEEAAMPSETHTRTLEDVNREFKKVEKTMNNFAKAYFSGNKAHLLGEFQAKFVSMFYDNLLNTRTGVGKLGYNSDIEQVLALTKQEMGIAAANADPISPDADIANLPESGREAYYLQVMDLAFDDVAQLLLPGLELNKSWDWETETVRTSWGDSGGFDGMDQRSAVMKLHIETTPRMIQREDGSWTQDKDNPYLTNYEVKAVANIINSFPNNLDGFRKEMKYYADSKGPNQYIFRALYNKFFNPDKYYLDGEERVSISSIEGDERTEEITSAFLTFFRSIQGLEHLVVNNGEVGKTSTQNAEVAAIVVEDLTNNLTSFSDKTKLKTKVADRLSVMPDTDGTFELFFGGHYSVKFTPADLTRENNSGVAVNIHEDSIQNFEDTDEAVRALKALGMPSYINRKFVEFWKDNYTNFSTTAGEEALSMPNFIANMAFMVAMNDPETREALGKHNFALPQSSAILESDSLPYPPLGTHTYAFKDLLTQFSEITGGITAKKMRMNGDGNFVPVVGVKSRIYDTQNLANKLAVSKDTVHSKNVLVNGEWKISGLAGKDGFTTFGKRRGNSSLTKAEQAKYLIEDAFLVYASQNGFRRALVQPGAMSDRSLVEMLEFEASGDSMEFVPLDWSVTKDGMNKMQRKFIDTQADFHNSYAQQTVEDWKKQLNNWLTEKHSTSELYTQEEVDNIKNIKDLNSFLLDKEIPYEAAASSDILVLEARYVKGKNKTAQLKQAFVTMYDIWNDKDRARKFTSRAYWKFRSDLKKAGYTADIMSNKAFNILQERLGLNSTDRNLAFNALMNAYFYQTNILSNSAMNLQMGSFYQFKGDLDIESIKNDPIFQRQMEEDAKAMLEAGYEEGAILLHQETRAEELALDFALNDMFLAQSKRNAGLGSGFQHPRLAKATEEGLYLDEFTTTALIEDPEIEVKLLGKLGGQKQEVYDAVVMAHPLYFLKLNNSLGGSQSGYISKGGAVKDISNELDERTGILRFQKKATFNQFSAEMLSNGDPKLIRLFRKMNESIDFKEFTTKRDANGNIIEEGQNLVLDYQGEVQEFSNLQELFEFVQELYPSEPYGSETVWKAVGKILGENPAYRAAYVEKIGFKSGEKTGNRAFNKKSVWESDSKKDSLRWTKFSNEQHGVILNADHNPDSTHTTHGEKSLMTQVISSVVFEGDSADIAKQINGALGTLSDAGLDRIKSEIDNIAVSILRAEVKSGIDSKIFTTPESRQRAKNALDSAFDEGTALSSQLKSFLEDNGFDKKAEKEWVRKITEEAVKKREAFGIVTDLAGKKTAALDTLQLQSIVHSEVMNALNKATTKIKFRGQEFVVSPSHDFNKLYTIPGTNKLVKRSEYMNSDETAYDTLAVDQNGEYLKEDLDLISDADLVKVNSVLMPAWKARKIHGSLKNAPNLQAKLPRDSRPLKWLGYTDKDGNSVEDTVQYKNLYENGEALAEAMNAKDKELVKQLEEERKILEVKLMELMEDESMGWEAEDAEFFMPMTHMEAFDLDDPENVGNPGFDVDENGTKRGINISDIMGTEQTGAKKWYVNGKVVDSKVVGAYAIYDSELEHMKEFFKSRITEEHSERHKLYLFEPVEIGTIADYQSLIESLKAELKEEEAGNKRHRFLKKQISMLERLDLPTDVDSDFNFPAKLEKDFNNLLESQLEEYVESIANKRALSFPKTLEMIAARIPAQGKQSFVSGRVKGFITSNRNAIYGPAEMLTVTGADHDIDKAHVLVYGVDADGMLFDYTKYLVDGDVSRDAYNQILEEKIANKIKYLKEAGANEETIQKAVEELRKTENEYFQEAAKNFVLDKLRQSIQDPRNAVEAATPVSMKKLQDALKKKEEGVRIERLDEEDGDEGGLVFGTDEVASPFNPFSIPAVEITNAIGKKLVGVNATGIKGYSAIYTAVLDDPDNEYIQFSSEINRLFGEKPNKELKSLYDSLFKEETEDNSFNLYYTDANGDIKRISRKRIANSDKWSNEERGSDNKWKTLVQAWKQAGMSQEEIDSRIAEEAEYQLSVQRKLEPQAWEDISELLSAATDNAKELLLGRLGIDENTNGLVVAGIVMGFDLEVILDLLSDDNLQDIIQAVKNSQDTVLNPTDFSISLKKALEKSVTDPEKLAADLVDINDKIRVADDKTKISLPLAKDVAAKSGGISSIDESKIYIPGNGYSGKLGLEVIESTIEPPSKADELAIQKLIGDGYKELTENGLGQANSIYQTINGANTIIISSPSSLPKARLDLIKNYVNANPDVSLFSFSSGAWSEFDGSDFKKSINNPVIGSKTALVSGTEISDNFNNSILDSIADTKLAIENPSEYNSLVASREEDLKKDLADKKELLNDLMEDYLTDAPRQALELLKIASEQRAVTSLLAINQGIPNSDWDAFNYLNKFLKAVNEQLPEEDGKGKDKGKKVKINPFTHQDLKNFIKAVESNDVENIDKAIKRYEKYKVAINPFYVLSKNPHYFGYIKSFIFGQDLIRSTTFINETIENLVHEFDLASDVTQDGYSQELKSFVYGVAIDKFLKSEGGLFNIDNKSFNLGTARGRADFLESMVEITNKFKGDVKLSNNPLINSLKYDSLKDAKLGDFLTIIRTLNLNNVTDLNKAQIKMGLDQLRDLGGEYAVYHDALFLYSLILNKGSRGNKSFSSLFDLDTQAYKRYVDFLNDNKDTLKRDILITAKEMKDVAFKLSNPSFIPVKSTQQRSGGEASLTDMGIDVDPSELQGYSSNGSPVDNQYSVPTTNEYGDIFRSKQTGKVYVWDSTKGPDGKALGYIVVNADVPLKAIPYTSGLEGLEAAGFRFGETAKINEEGDTVQVLKYEGAENGYLVRNKRGDFEYISDEELSIYNDDMAFRGKRFGKKTKQEMGNAKFNNIKKSSETQIWRLPLNTTAIKEIRSGVKKYHVVNNIPDNVLPGDTISTPWIRGTQVKITYVGFVDNTHKHIKYSLGSFSGNAANREFYYGESGKRHIVKIMPIRTPGTTEHADVPVDERAGLKVGYKTVARIVDSKATRFATGVDLNIEEGETKLLRLGSKKSGLWYKVTNMGVLSKDMDREELFTRFGYDSNSEQGRKALSKMINEGKTLYGVEPYDAKGANVNSHLEASFLGDDLEANLNDVTINLVGSLNNTNNTLVRESANSLGARTKSVSKSTDKFEEADRITEAVSQHDRLFKEDKELTPETVSSIVDSDMVVVIDDFIDEHAKSQKKKFKDAGITVIDPLTDKEQRLIEIFSDLSEEELIEELTRIEQNAERLGTELKLYRPVADKPNKLKRIARSLRNKLTAEDEVPTELKNITFNTARLTQAAKYSGKPLHIYSPSKQQWYQYDAVNGSFVPTRIPVAEGEVALFNADMRDPVASQGVTELLKKTSQFKSKQLNAVGKISTVTNLATGAIEADEEINEVIEEGTSVLEGIRQFDNFTKEETDPLNPRRQIFYEEIDGEKMYERDFSTFDNATVMELADGTILIESITNKGTVFNWAYFPSDADRVEKYANFTGDSVKENFKVKIEDTYYIFSKLHRVDKEAFLRRNLLIEEKKEAAKLFEEAQDYYTNTFGPLYSAIRFADKETRDKFKNYRSVKQFMLYVKHGDIDLDLKTRNELIEAYDNFLIKQNIAKEFVEKVQRENTTAMPRMEGVSKSFFDITPDEDHVLVFLTDSNGSHKEVDKRISSATQQYLRAGKWNAQINKAGELKGFGLPIANRVVSGKKVSYELNQRGYVSNSVNKLIALAKENPNKTFYFELPGDLSGTAYGNLETRRVYRALARALSNAKVSGIPSNIKFTNGSADLLSQFRGNLSPEDINRTVPFKVTRDATVLSAFDISARGFTPYSLKIGERSIASLWNEMRGYTISDEESEKMEGSISISDPAVKGNPIAGQEAEHYKDLWRQWAEANPARFEALAMMVKKNPLYDPFHTEGTGFSTGKILADLLTERYVDNAWLDYPRWSMDIELNEDQTIIPLESVSPKNGEGNRFNYKKKGGKALVTINDNTYVATIKNISMNPDNTNDRDFLEKLGLGEEESPMTEAIAKYPFIADKNFAVVQLTEFHGEIIDANPVTPGTFSQALKERAANSEILRGKISMEHMLMAEQATIAYGIDSRARITDDIEASFSGTDWIKEYKRAIGQGIVDTPSKFDTVWIYGSTLEDGNNPETINGVIQSTKLLIDKAARVGAKILVGTGTGVEEEIRSYIMSNYPKYNPTADGLGFEFNGEVKIEYNSELGQNGNLYKAGSRVGRFNSNNTQNREGADLTGAWGTILYSSTESAKAGKDSEIVKDYRVNIKEEEIRDWDSVISTETVMDMVQSLGLEVDDTAFDSVRGALAVTERRYMRHFLGASLLLKHNSLKDVNNTNELDQLVDDVRNPDSKSYNGAFAADYKEAYERIFKDDGTLNISDVGILAMSKNRNITENYAKEIFPELYTEEFSKHPISKFISAERREFDRGSGYFRMLNSNKISEDTLKLISGSTNVTVRDAYNLVKTLGEKKIIGKGNNISGLLVNNMFADLGIKAFRDGEKLIVIDNDVIYSSRVEKIVEDYSETELTTDLSDLDLKLARSGKHAQIYRYLKSRGTIEFNTQGESFRITLGDFVKTYEADKDGFNEMNDDVRALIVMSYVSKFDGVNFMDEDGKPDFAHIKSIMKQKDWPNLNGLTTGHMKLKRENSADNFSALFFRETKDELPGNIDDVKPGKIYLDPRGTKTFVMQDVDGRWFAQSADGVMYYNIAGEWDIAKGINNKVFSNDRGLVRRLADDKGSGLTFSMLYTTKGEHLKGEFEVTRKVEYYDDNTQTEEVTAENHVNGAKYRWESLVKAWSPIESMALNFADIAADADVVKGQVVFSLPIENLGNKKLINGKALSETLVKDETGTYEKQPSGSWIKIKDVAAFKNADVKYQKGAIEFTDVNGQALASKVVSKDTMRAVFNKLFNESAIEARLVTAEDIRTEFGDKYATASGFVKDGVIIINLDKATLDTPLHEFGGHIYLAHLKATDPDAYNEIINKALEHDMMPRVAELYPELDRTELGEEVFSTLFGLGNQSKLTGKSLTKWEKILKLANNASSIVSFFKNAFKVIFGTDTDFELDTNDSLMTIIDKLGDNIVFGKASVINSLTDMQVDNLKKVMHPEIDQQTIQRKLEDLGYIRTICR